MKVVKNNSNVHTLSNSVQEQPLKPSLKQHPVKPVIKPKHGGNALAMCKQYGIDPADCIDLTAAINPKPYPIPDIPSSIWQQLPQEHDGLEEAAAAYYGLNLRRNNGNPIQLHEHFMMVPGSSWAIHALPNCLGEPQRNSVWVPAQGFAEHKYAWQKNGFDVLTYEQSEALIEKQSEKIFPSIENLKAGDIVVLINPNNPTTQLYNKATVLKLLKTLEDLSGYLIVDEAFMDCTPEHSIMQMQSDALIVMRSFGKFFGLAGTRLGAIKANSTIIQKLKDQLPPWSINAPARYIAKCAYADTQWQQQARLDLKEAGNKLSKVLEQISQSFPDAYIKKAELFQTVYTSSAKALHEQLAQQGIFTRLLDSEDGVRFGLPSEGDFQKLPASSVK